MKELPVSILPQGTRIVTRVQVKTDRERSHKPVGAVAEIVVAPTDHLHSYRVRFAEGGELLARRTPGTRGLARSAGADPAAGRLGVAVTLRSALVSRQYAPFVISYTRYNAIEKRMKS